MVGLTAAEERRRLYESSMVTLTWSHEDESGSLYIHKSVYNDSPLAVKVRTHSWYHPKTGDILIKSHEKHTIAGYIDWLYHGKLEGYRYHDGEANYWGLARLYILGRSISDDELCREAIELFLQGLDFVNSEGRRDLPGHELIELVCRCTRDVSALRYLLVDCIVELGDKDWFEEVGEWDLGEFVVEVMVGLSRMKKKGDEQSFYERRGKWMWRD